MPSPDNDQTLISLLNPANWSNKTNGTNKHPDTDFSLKDWLKKQTPTLLLLTALVLVAYLYSLGNGLVSDDAGLKLEGIRLGSLNFLKTDPSQPIRYAMYVFLYHLSGGEVNPLLFRLPNLFFHLGNTYLVFLIAYLLLNYRVALLTAALFSVHSIISEAVIWISGGGYVQYTFFFLLSFVCYILDSQSRPGKSRRYFYWSIGFFILAILSSNRVITLFPIFIVYEFVYGSLKKYWKRLLPVILLSIGDGLIYFFQIGQRLDNLNTQYYLEKGYDNLLIKWPFAIVNYLQLFIWPSKLTFFHSNLALNYFQLAVYWLFFLPFLGLFIWSFFKKRTVFFWLSFFIISLILTLTPYRFAWVVAERYVYMGAIGIFVLFAMLVTRFITSANEKIFLAILILIIAFLTIRTIIRSNDWKDEAHLWRATVATSPESPKAHNFMGAIYVDEKNPAAAEKEFQTAIKLKPNYADAYHNLANLYQGVKKYDLAVPLYGQALKINPQLWKSWENLAGIYLEQNDYQKALDYMGQALKVSPNEPELWTSLGIVYLKKGDKDKALQAVQKALTLNPFDVRAGKVLGMIK